MTNVGDKCPICSREGHGTGFWDRGYPNGDELHEGSKHYGEGPVLLIDDEAETIDTL